MEGGDGEEALQECKHGFVLWALHVRTSGATRPFLVKLNQLIEWDAFVDALLPAYKGLAETGRRPYPQLMLLKMLVIAYLHEFSERQAERAANYDLAVKESVGLGADEFAPDHSTLCDFKRRLRETGGRGHFEAIGDMVLRQAQAAGIRLGRIQVLDSVHTVANVDNTADRERQGQGKPPRDRQAQLVKKGTRRRQTRTETRRRKWCSTWATRAMSAWMPRAV